MAENNNSPLRWQQLRVQRRDVLLARIQLPTAQRQKTVKAHRSIILRVISIFLVILKKVSFLVRHWTFPVPG